MKVSWITALFGGAVLYVMMQTADDFQHFRTLSRFAGWPCRACPWLEPPRFLKRTSLAELSASCELA